MAITPNMDLDLPSVGVTVGPEWASDLNTALTTVDSHDHSDGKGVKINPSGINITSDLDFNANSATDVLAVQLSNQVATNSDTARVQNVAGDLYWNNGTGTPVQITNGTSVNASTDGVSRRYESTAISSNTVIAPSDTFSFIGVDTTTSVLVTLPAANGVTAGRFYDIQDVMQLAGTNNITVRRAGSDTQNGSASDVVLNYNGAGGRWVSNGVSNWKYTISQGTVAIQTAQIASSAITSAKIADSNVTTAKINDGAVTTDKIGTSSVTHAKIQNLGSATSSSSSSFSTTSTSFVDVTNLSVSVTTTGGQVRIFLDDDGSESGSYTRVTGTAVTSIAGQLAILRDGVEIARYRMGVGGASGTQILDTPVSAYRFEEQPAAGTYTYKVQARILTTGTCQVNFAKLKVREFI